MGALARWLACLVLLPVIAAAQPRRGPQVARRSAPLTVPAPSPAWEVVLEPLLQLPLLPGEGPRLLVIDSEQTSPATTSRLVVAGHVLGYFIHDCAPQLAVFAHEYSPLDPRTVRCHIMVVSPCLRGQTVTWGQVEGVFTDVAWACSVPMRVSRGPYGRDEIGMLGCVESGRPARKLVSATLSFDDTVTVKEPDDPNADAAVAEACQASGNGLVLVRDRRAEITSATHGALRGQRLLARLDGILAGLQCRFARSSSTARVELSSVDDTCIDALAAQCALAGISAVRLRPQEVIDESGAAVEMHGLVITLQ